MCLICSSFLFQNNNNKRDPGYWEEKNYFTAPGSASSNRELSNVIDGRRRSADTEKLKDSDRL